MNERNAIILSAGMGERMRPLTDTTPKGLIKVKGEVMLERQIEQLNEAGVRDIVIVVGYLKEKFDYLVDKYGVKLVFNPEFQTKNNLASINCVLDSLNNTYLCCSDIYFHKNPFNKQETTSWYGCPYFEGKTNEWGVKLDADNKITEISIGGEDCYAFIGPVFFNSSFSEKFKPLVKQYYAQPESKDYYWEHVLKENIDDLEIYVNNQSGNVLEFDTFDELCEYDNSYSKEKNHEN